MSFRRFTWPLVAAVCLTAGFYLSTYTTPLFGPHTVHAADAKPTAPVNPEVAAPLAELSHAFRTVHNAIKGAVVNIDTKKAAPPMSNNRRRMFQLPIPVPPDMMPDDNGPQAPGNGAPGANGAPGQLQKYGTGSGVIISPDGYIVTNNHVVEGADSISVQLDDGRTLPAKIIGRDPKADLAVVKIDALKLTYAKFGDSDELEVGDWVLAFGSPFGFEQTMTQGIVSAKGRSINIIAEHDVSLTGLTYENYIQTDAAINPGNSGGPLVNLKGEVIGINAAIASYSGAYNGIGFSIPSNDAKWIVDSMIKNGKVVRGYMGVGIADIHSDDPAVQGRLNNLKYEGKNGVLVLEILQESPARNALQLNDIIVALNGEKVNDITELRSKIARTAPGTKITLGVYRGGKTVDVSFTVGTQPDTTTKVASAQGNSAHNPGVVDLDNLGLSVTDSSKGIVITEINPDGLASGVGLNKGDVIFNAQGKEVRNVDDLKALISKGSLDKGIALSVHSADGSDRSVYIMRQG